MDSVAAPRRLSSRPHPSAAGTTCHNGGVTKSLGHVWIAGAGPGDPALATVAVVTAISQAEVILYDALASPALLKGAQDSAELIYVGKRAAQHAMSQDEINAALVGHALAGRQVLRLKGGDPFVFGRGSEEALACQRASVPFTVIPGVTSAIAGPAYAGIPVTHRGIAANFLVVTGNDAGGDEGAAVDWAFAARADTLLILMGVTTLQANMDRLLAAGKPPETPVACVRWGTRPDQQVVRGTVANIAETARAANLASPVVTVVGEVAGLAGELAWFGTDRGNAPLAGRTVVVTRARAQASDLVARFEALGAFVVELPVISVRLRDDGLSLSAGVSGRWDWIVFTSSNGVEAFFRQLGAAGSDARALAGTQIACVGAATSEALARFGVRADFLPSRATSDALADELPDLHGARVLFPASALTDDRFAGAVRKRGGLVEQVAVYDNLFQPIDEERRRELMAADAIVFSSASTATNLKAGLGEADLPATAKLVSIGPQTTGAVRAAFGRLDAEAARPALDALIDATIEALR